MIRFRLNELLEERGQTVYWLWKQTGIRYATVWKMSKGEVTRLNVEALDRIAGMPARESACDSDNPEQKKAR